MRSAQHAATRVLPEALGRLSEDFTVDALEVSFTAHDETEDLIAAMQAIGSSDLEMTSAAITPPSLDDVFLGTAFAVEGEAAEEN